jgi:AraC-like DNA-binding protein
MPDMPAHLCANHRSFRTLAGAGDRGLLGCGFMLKPPGWDCRQAARSAYSAVLVLRGQGWYADADGRRWPLQPGSLFQRFTGVAHSVWVEKSPAWAECWIHFGAPVEDMLTSLGAIDRDQPVMTPGLDLALVRELWRSVAALDAAHERQLPAHLVRLQGLLLSMLGSERRAAPTASFDSDRACRLLADDPRLDLRLAARELGLPYGAFRKNFRRAVGLGPGEYRLRRRLERARAELLGSDKPISTIAAELGYANPFTFTNLFRKHVGIAPSAWRRGAR